MAIKDAKMLEAEIDAAIMDVKFLTARFDRIQWAEVMEENTPQSVLDKLHTLDNLVEEAFAHDLIGGMTRADHDRSVKRAVECAKEEWDRDHAGALDQEEG